MFKPLPFQEDAIEELIERHLLLWEKEENQLPLVFKSPTGSGKTFMLAHFVSSLNRLPNWDVDKAFIWITFSDDLAMQSKQKFEEYFENTLENRLLTVNDIDKGKLSKNDVLFLNWQKVVAREAENRVLRRPDDERLIKESGFYFEDFIDGTKDDFRSIILIIDEAHTNVTPDLAQDIIDYINPKIVLHVSATPKDTIIARAAEHNSFVQVDRKKVIEQGLIKEKIITQTEEDLLGNEEEDLDEVLLDLGLKKREQLSEEFKSIGKTINPLLLIQLPNDDRDRVSSGEKTKEQITTDYLTKVGVPEEKIGKWFDDHPKPEDIEDNDDNHDILMFKLAAGTGWDCPRAHVLVMFRNITVEQRYIQTVGRILRMPEPAKIEDYKNNPNLRSGFLFTNYNRQSILDNWIDKSQSKPYIYISTRKQGINNLKLESSYLPRINYGDLSNSSKFQSSFVNSMNEYFGISDEDEIKISKSKLENFGLDLDPSVKNQVVVDAEYKDLDKLNYEFRHKGHDISIEMSQNDVEKTLNYFCFQLLREQTEEDAKVTNIARSWSPLKSALRVWMSKSIDSNSEYYYRVFIKDIQRGSNSIFRPATTKALKDYRPIINKILAEKYKEEEEKDPPIFSIKDSYSFTDDYEEMPSELFVLEKFYLRKNYRGRINEYEFYEFIDGQFDYIDWWFKQESGRDYFAIKYFNTRRQRYALFYPDWIVRFKDERIGIFDTKAGATASDPEGRAEALSRKLSELGASFIGGILVRENNVWYYNNCERYEYTPGMLSDSWKPLLELFRNN